LKERVLELEEALMQKNKEVEVYAESIDKMRLEKEILEKEWNRVVKAVKKKITKIVDEK
jgi:ribosomal protein L21